MSKGFDDVPIYQGRRLFRARGEQEYSFYLSWLADYLYRPMPGQTWLLYGEASRRIVGIESEMADWVWERPIMDHPTPSHEGHDRPGHADFSHRKELSAILSAVFEKQDRVKLLDWLYQELDADARK